MTIRHPELEGGEPAAHSGLEPLGDRPGLRAVAQQLADDTDEFVRAEIAWFKAQADERVSYAIPGVILLSVGTAMGAGAVVALILGLLLVLSGPLGQAGATAVVTITALIIAAILLRLGIDRLRNALKPREDR